MSSPVPDILGMITTTEGWIRHVVDNHKQMPGTPSPDEMRNHPAVLAKMIGEHADLHVHFYTGHEHERVGHLDVVVSGRTK